VNYNVLGFRLNPNFTLIAQVIIGSINVTIQSCNNNKAGCVAVASAMLVEPTNMVAKLNFTCSETCQVIVSQYASATDSKFSLLNNLASQRSLELQPSKSITDILNFNECQFYFINITALQKTNFTNSTTITIRKVDINGDSFMLTSTTVTQPAFNDIFFPDQDVEINWDGTATFLINSTFPNYIYIGVKGNTQCIYHIQFALNISANIPAAYLNMVEEGQNDYTLSSSSPFILLKYISHIIPYTIKFDPNPSCIKYGNKLPLSPNCTSPTQKPQ
jgi:hypothetical protein